MTWRWLISAVRVLDVATTLRPEHVARGFAFNGYVERARARVVVWARAAAIVATFAGAVVAHVGR